MLVRCRNDAGTMLVRCRNGAGFRFRKWEPFRACSLEMQGLCSPSEEQQNMVAHQTNPSGANQQRSYQNARHLPTCLLNTCINRAGRIGTSTPIVLYMWGLGGTTRHTKTYIYVGQWKESPAPRIVWHEGCHIVGALDSLPHSVSPKGSSSPKTAAEVHPMLIFQGQTPGCVRPEFFQICLGRSATLHPLYPLLMLLCSPVVPGGEQELCTAPASRPHVLHRAP